MVMYCDSGPERRKSGDFSKALSGSRLSPINQEGWEEQEERHSYGGIGATYQRGKTTVGFDDWEPSSE